MQILQSQYEVQTKVTKIEILKNLKRKIEFQKKDNGSLFDLVNYQQFKINDDKIEVNKLPSILNPNGGIGKIHFELSEVTNGTKITCTLEPLNKYGLLIGFFFALLFLIIITPVMLLIHDNYTEALLIICLIWAALLGVPYLIVRYYRSALKEYSQIILNDLDIK